MPVAKVNGINISYQIAGQGEPLLMIMGFSANHQGWSAQVPFFKKYYQVVTFDNRGVGKSDKPPGPYTTRMMADDTVGLLEHLGIKKCDIIGVSMGGMIAQEIAINYPERVSRLVLAATYACKEGDSGDTPYQAEALRLGPQKMPSVMIDLAMNKPIYKFTFGFIAKLQSRFLSASDRIGLDGQAVACNNHNTFDRLPLIQAHTLVIGGTQDRIIKPSSSDVIAKRIPNSRLVKVENGSHAFNIEFKNRFNLEVLKFLALRQFKNLFVAFRK